MSSSRSGLPQRLSRRELLQLGAFGAVIGYRALGTPATAQTPGPPQGPAATPPPSAFITRAADGRYTLILPAVEMGQGIATVLAAVVAQELGLAHPDELIVEAAPRAAVYRTRGAGAQTTAASASMYHWYLPLRRAARAVRASVDASPPDDTPLRPKAIAPAGNRYAADIVGGVHGYGVDVVREGMLHAAVSMDPRGSREPTAANTDAARAIKGVVDVVRIPGGVAVLARSHWTAERAAAALQLEWPEQAAPADVHATLFAALDASAGIAAVERKPASETPTPGRPPLRTLSARYTVPYLAHAALEPLACTAEWQAGRCHVWLGTQSPDLVARDIAAAMGVEPDDIEIHNLPIGGSFGRRVIGNDVAVQAARLARHAGKPVKLIWSREQDLHHDRFRPAVVASLVADVDSRGRPHALRAKVCGSDWIAETGRARPQMQALVNTQGLSDLSYEIPRLDVRFVEAPTPVQIGPWRSIGHGFSVFFIESFIDELAVAAGRDPLDYRSGLLPAGSAGHSVIEAVRRSSGWSRRADQADVDWGVSLQFGWNTWIAVVTRVQRRRGAVAVSDIWAAVDCGVAINPPGVVKQIEGGLNFGLSAALFEQITLDGAGARQSNFHDYRLLRFDEAPTLHVELISSGRELVGGIGECATSAVMPSVANALAALDRRRIRRLPLTEA